MDIGALILAIISIAIEVMDGTIATGRFIAMSAMSAATNQFLDRN
jgi:hypothetical protein